MTSQQHLFTLHKKITSTIVNGRYLKNINLPRCLVQRALSKAIVPPGTSSESHELKRHTDSEQSPSQTEAGTQAKWREHPEASTEAAFANKWKPLKSSSAAQKYFKHAFLNNYSLNNTLGEDRNRKNTADVFGSLSGGKSDKSSNERDANERLGGMFPEDVDESRDRRLNIPLSREGRIGKNAYYYTRKMSILARQGKIKEAIAIFDHWMMLRDRVMPNKRTFTVLIGILGRVGYTDKAFELYSKMRNLGLDPEDQVYTGLFNACANSPWPSQALKSAENLLSTLQSNGVQLHLITVKAAAKAMALCGNFPRAFSIMEEAWTYTSLDTECFDHLLMACCADKQAGFNRAVQVWQKMQEFQVQPHTSSYNFLIRCARDCSIGSPDDFAKTIGLTCGRSEVPSQIHSVSFGQQAKTWDKNNVKVSLPVVGDVKNSNINVNSQQMHSCVQNITLNVPDEWTHTDSRQLNNSATESCAPKQESHNLFHDIPNFDRDMDKFLMHRDVQREKAGSADMYEWWEEQPSDRQQLHQHQLSLHAQADWALEEDEALSEGQVNALDLGSQIGGNLKETVPTVSGWCYSNKLAVPQSNSNSTQASPSEDETRETVEIKRVKDISTPAARLALLGGARRLVRHMVEAGAMPDVKTFSQLVPCLPDTEAAENGLLHLMQEIGVKPDVDLINDVMMKRNLRHKSHTAKELLPVMSRLGLVPNMRTYAALALTCLKEQDAHSLLRDMKAANLEPSSKVMGHFIYISRSNYSYKLHMLRRMEWMGLAPEPETIRVIEKSIAMTKKNIIAMEKREDKSSYHLSNEYQESFRRFLQFYKGWLQRTTIHKPPHPWKAFQMQDDKNEDEIDDNENKKVKL